MKKNAFRLEYMTELHINLIHLYRFPWTGYYKNLRGFINERLPPGIDVSHLPPLAQTSLDLTLRPLKVTGQHPAFKGQRSVSRRVKLRFSAWWNTIQLHSFYLSWMLVKYREIINYLNFIMSHSFQCNFIILYFSWYAAFIINLFYPSLFSLLLGAPQNKTIKQKMQERDLQRFIICVRIIFVTLVNCKKFSYEILSEFYWIIEL